MACAAGAVERMEAAAQLVAMDGIIRTTLPHSAFGGLDCCGCLNGVIHGGGQADIICNEWEQLCERCRLLISSEYLMRWNWSWISPACTVRIAEPCTGLLASRNCWPSFATSAARQSGLTERQGESELENAPRPVLG